MSGEFKSMTEIHNAVPAFAPTPIAWGTYASDSDVHFFLCSFHQMPEELPDVQRFSAQVAELHRMENRQQANTASLAQRSRATCPETTAGLTRGNNST